MTPEAIAVTLALKYGDALLARIMLTAEQKRWADDLANFLLDHANAGTVPTDAEWDVKLANIADKLARSQAAADRS